VVLSLDYLGQQSVEGVSLTWPSLLILPLI
jgi:hypothetical protein